MEELQLQNLHEIFKSNIVYTENCSILSQEYTVYSVFTYLFSCVSYPYCFTPLICHLYMVEF